MQKLESLPQYYQSYLAELDQFISFTESTVNDALAKVYELYFDLFSQIYPEQLAYAYAENKWTIAEVFGHVIDTDRIFSYRALRIARNDSKGLEGYDENKYVEVSNYHLRTFDSIKQELLCVFESTAYLFEALTDNELNRLGNANGFVLSPRTIGMVIAAHRLHHYNILQERYLSEKQ